MESTNYISDGRLNCLEDKEYYIFKNKCNKAKTELVFKKRVFDPKDGKYKDGYFNLNNITEIEDIVIKTKGGIRASNK